MLPIRFATGASFTDLLTDDSIAEIMRKQTLKALDEGLALTNKKCHRIAQETVRLIAEEVVAQISLKNSEFAAELIHALEGNSNAVVHKVFKSLVKTCGFENLLLIELPSCIQARIQELQRKAADCWLTLLEYYRILDGSRLLFQQHREVDYKGLELLIAEIAQEKHRKVDSKGLELLIAEISQEIGKAPAAGLKSAFLGRLHDKLLDS